jgi:hypothetical protein
MLTEGQLVVLVGLLAFSPYTRCEWLVDDTQFSLDVPELSHNKTTENVGPQLDKKNQDFMAGHSQCDAAN